MKFFMTSSKSYMAVSVNYLKDTCYMSKRLIGFYKHELDFLLS